MKKRISSLLLALALCLCFCVSAFAADATSTVTYTGSELQVGNPTINFADMLPGTSRSQDIVITNDSEKTADFYMDIQVLKALEDAREGEQAGAAGAAYTFSLSFATNAGTSYVYGTDANGNTVGGQQSAGMYELNEDLDLLTASENGSWMHISKLAPGETATVNFSVDLDGTATANDYQDRFGQFSFAFRCEDETNTVITEEKEENKVITVVNTVIRSVQTGDDSPILLLSMVMGVGIVLIVFLCVRRKKSRAEK